MTNPSRPAVVMSGISSTRPLARPLADHYDLVVVHGDAAQQMAFEELPVMPIGNLLDPNMNAHALTVATTMAAKVVEGIEDGRLLRQFRQAGSMELARNLGNWFPGYIHDALRRQAAFVMALDRLLDTRDVAACVVHEDVTETFALLALWAKRRGVPCVHVPHAVYHRPSDHAPVGEDVHDRVLASHVAAIGTYQAEWYRERSDEVDIRLTGSPQWDHWTRIQRDPEWARKALGLFPGPVWVYLASWSQWTLGVGDLNNRYMEHSERLVMQAAREAGVQLVYKIHPNAHPQEEQRVAQAAREMGTTCWVVRPYLDLVLQAVDVAIAFGPSNALIEAALMNVPGVTVFDAGAFGDTGWVRHANGTVDSLIEAVRAERSSANRDTLIERFAYRADGKATERVVGYVREVASWPG